LKPKTQKHNVITLSLSLSLSLSHSLTQISVPISQICVSRGGATTHRSTPVRRKTKPTRPRKNKTNKQKTKQPKAQQQQYSLHQCDYDRGLWKSWGRESVERDTERGRERGGEGTFWVDHYGLESFGRMGDLSGEEASHRSWRAAKRKETRRHGERDCVLWVGLSFFLSSM